MDASTSVEKLIWPNFYIVGAPKSGTTAMYAHLKTHPDVFLPKMKEPNYFTSTPPPPEIRDDFCVGNLAAYQSLYRGAENFAAIGDMSTAYLWDEGAPRRIHDVCPKAKIIIILRDPVMRAYSAYLMDALVGSERLSSFYEAIQRDQNRDIVWRLWRGGLYIERGMYHDQILRYFETFGREQVLVLTNEELSKSPLKLYENVAKHLNIDASLFDPAQLERRYWSYRMPKFMPLYRLLSDGEAGRLRRKLTPAPLARWLQRNTLLYNTVPPEIEERARIYLQEVYTPEVDRLEKLLGRSLPELRKSWR